MKASSTTGEQQHARLVLWRTELEILNTGEDGGTKVSPERSTDGGMLVPPSLCDKSGAILRRCLPTLMKSPLCLSKRAAIIVCGGDFEIPKKFHTLHAPQRHEKSTTVSWCIHPC